MFFSPPIGETYLQMKINCPITSKSGPVDPFFMFMYSRSDLFFLIVIEVNATVLEHTSFKIS